MSARVLVARRDSAPPRPFRRSRCTQPRPLSWRLDRTASRYVRQLAALGEAIPRDSGGGPARIVLADARAIPRELGPVDGVLTSPPYPGVYDYLAFTPPQSGLAEHVARGAGEVKAFGGESGQGVGEIGEIGSRAERSALESDSAGGCFSDRWQADTVKWLTAAAAVLRPGGRMALLIGDDSGINCLESITSAAAAVSRSAPSHALDVLASASLNTQATRPWARQASRGRGYRREHTILLEKRCSTEGRCTTDGRARTIPPTMRLTKEAESGEPTMQRTEETTPWPAPTPISHLHATTSAHVHVVGVVARRRMLSKRLAFVDLHAEEQEDGTALGGEASGASVQLLVRTGDAGGVGLDRDIWRHELMPGSRLAVLGVLGAEATSRPPPPSPPAAPSAPTTPSPPASPSPPAVSPPTRTLIASEIRLRHVAPSEQGVGCFVAAVHAAILAPADALAPLTDACVASAPAQRAAAAELARQLLHPTSRVAGVTREDDKAHTERVRELAALLATASSPRVVALARSGGGHAHVGLVDGRQVAALAFLYDDRTSAGAGAVVGAGANREQGGRDAGEAQLMTERALSPQAGTILRLAREAGGTLAASAALGAPPLSIASALRDGAFATGAGGWVTLEGHVVSRMRVASDLARGGESAEGAEPAEGGSSAEPAAAAVLLSLSDAPAGWRSRPPRVLAPTGDRRPDASEAAGGRPQLRCLLHPALILTCADAPDADARAADAPDTDFALGDARLRTFAELAAQGARVRLAGRWAPRAAATPEAPPLLIVFAIRLERCSGVKRVVRAALDALADGRLTNAEAARALAIPGDLEATPLTRAIVRGDSRAARAWRAAELSAGLRLADPAAALRSEAARKVIDEFDGFRQRYPIRPLALGAEAVPLPSSAPPSRRVTSGTPTATSLAQRATAGDGSFWNVKKRPQLVHMVAQVRLRIAAPNSSMEPSRASPHTHGHGHRHGKTLHAPLPQELPSPPSHACRWSSSSPHTPSGVSAPCASATSAAAAASSPSSAHARLATR